MHGSWFQASGEGTPPGRTRRTVLVVASVGGHLDQMLVLLSTVSCYDYYFVLEDCHADLPQALENRTLLVPHGERNLNNIRQFVSMGKILWRLRPGAIITCGASPAVPACLLGALLHIPTLYIETISSILRPTLTGKILRHFADTTLYQWPELSGYFPRGIYAGTIYNFGHLG